MKRCAVTILLLVMTAALLVSVTCTREKQNNATATTPKKKIALWNGKDFTGWKLFVPVPLYDTARTWSVKDGVIRCVGTPNGYMRTEKDYADYLLHIEWRWVGNGGNSGVLVHMTGGDEVWPKSLECQLKSGNAGDFYVIGGVEVNEHAMGGSRVEGRRVIKLKQSSEKPFGQWNSCDVICKDDWIVVLANGVLQNVGTGCSENSGKICLQSEGTPIEFRNIYIEPLK